MKEQKKKNEELKQLPSLLPKQRSLQAYSDYVDLIQDVINGVLTGSIARQDAHTVAILTGYGIQALREATGGKMKMSVFLQDMHRNRIKVEMLSQEEMDRFLQGSEDIQIEVLKQLEDRGGVVEAEVTVKPDKQPKARLDTKLLSDMTGIEPNKVTAALAGEAQAPLVDPGVNHEWTRDLAAMNMFCLNCGVDRSTLRPTDRTWRCSQTWGLQ